MTNAIYAFSGDPITYGHIDVIERAAKVFDEVVVGIGINPDKKYMFNLEERANMARRSLIGIPNAKVVSFEGLLVDYAYENGVSVIVKGVRNSADFDYENVLHQIGESQKLGIDTHILFARPWLSHISSSAVKAIQKEQGLIHDYVPLYVKQCLEARMSGQYIVAVTGEIGAGKSYVSKKIEELGKQKDIQVHNIELDYIGHKILGELIEPLYQQVRNNIVEEFGNNVRLPDGFIDRKALGEIVFNDPNQLDMLNDIMHNPIIVRLKRELYGKKGLVLLNVALIAESGMAYLCNNNVVLVSADEASQKRRLGERNLTLDQIETRLSTQYNYEQKKEAIELAIEKNNQGKLWTVENSDGTDETSITQTFDDIVRSLNVK
jgi:pantetheine-phosphate adenylyltransferase